MAAWLLAWALSCGPISAQPGAPEAPQPESDPVRAQVQRALALLQAGENLQAEALLLEVVRIEPNHGTARLQLGQLALERGELAEARRHLEIATSSDPRRLYLAWFLTGRLELLESHAAAARAAFERALEVAPRFAPALVGRARGWLLEGRTDEALSDLRRALSLPGAPLEVARTAYAMGALELAGCAARRAVDQAPADGSVHVLLGDVSRAQGDANRAIESYRTAIARGHQSAATWLTLGRLLLDRMEMEAALAAYERAIELDPLAAEAIGSFALASLTSGETARWRALLERQVEARPESVDSLYALGRIHLREGRPEHAEHYLREVVRLRPSHTQAHYNLAQSLLRQGLAEEGAAALAAFDALDAREREEWERQNRAHRWRIEAEDALATDRPDAALEALRRIEAEGLAGVDDRLRIGEALLGSGRGAEALSEFTRIVAEAPFHREALEGTVRAATLLGLEEPAAGARQRLELLATPCP
jgi:tetratricopeptide (TPR) repeat protein